MRLRFASEVPGRRLTPRAVLLLALCSAAIGFSLTGCDGQRKALADLISPPDARQIAGRIDDAVEHDQGSTGITLGEEFLAKNPDPDGLVHRALVGAYLATGSAPDAARHMELAIADGASAAPKAAPPSAAPAPAPAASIAANNAAPLAPAVPAAPASVNGAAVLTSPAGISVRAGDAAVSLGR